MNFQQNTIFHIYNQGNNQRQVFFNDENYLFFLRKMREFLLPFGDLLCYCLMPNHFHWLFYVREVEIELPSVPLLIKQPTPSDPLNQEWNADEPTRTRTLNNAISILLRSYGRAINNQEGFSGSLFRSKTKAKNGWENPNIDNKHPDFGKIWTNWEEYGLTCFNYIHDNPKEADMVNKAIDWRYSSALDFAGLRNGTICNQALARKLLFLR